MSSLREDVSKKNDLYDLIFINYMNYFVDKHICTSSI